MNLVITTCALVFILLIAWRYDNIHAITEFGFSTNPLHYPNFGLPSSYEETEKAYDRIPSMTDEELAGWADAITIRGARNKAFITKSMRDIRNIPIEYLIRDANTCSYGNTQYILLHSNKEWFDDETWTKLQLFIEEGRRTINKKNIERAHEAASKSQSAG